MADRPILNGQTQDLGIEVTAVDLATGDRATKTIQPGNYALIVASPCRVEAEQHHANGTTVITLKGRDRSLMALAMVEPENGEPGVG